MPTQINEPPSQQGAYPPVPYSPVPNAPWLQQDDDDLDLTQLIRIVRRRGWIIAGIAITVASAFWGWTLTRTPIYRGEFRVLIESVDEANPSQELLLDERSSFGSTVDYDTQIEVLQSSALLQPITNELQERYPSVSVREIADNLSINRLRETKVLQISYRGTETQRIQDILEEIAQQYLEYSFEQRQASLSQGIEFVDDQLPELRDRVNNLQVQVERFRQQYSLLDPNSRGDDLSELISRVEDERQQLQTELSQARSLFQNLQDQLNVSPEEALAAATLSESPRYQSLLNQVQELEAQLAIDSAKYQPNSPQIAALRERRDNLLPILEAEAVDILGQRFAVGASDNVDGNLTPTSINLGRQLIDAANDVQMLQARSETLAQVEQGLKQEFALVPGLARQYTDMQRELSIATESLNRFLTTRETLQIDAAQKSVPWQLIAEPQTSPVPISPNIPRNLLLGILSGLALGGAAALLVEKLDQVYHSPEELKSATQLPLLGIIPFHPTLEESFEPHPTKSLNGTSDATTPVAVGEKGDRTTFRTSMFHEAFRSLYTNIRFLGTDAQIQAIVISSAVPSEGKSTLALYLARAASVMGQRVLLVDADLRSPQHHIRLGLPNIRGLSNLVSESFHIRDVIQSAALDENMDVITAGPVPPDPVKLLSSQRMQRLMEEFQEHYDLVIYDMPPIIGFSDSSLVAANTDGIVMVAGLGKTERSAISRALDEIKLSPASVLGVVANGIKAHTTRVYGYYNYHRYYQRRGQDNNPESRAIASSSMAKRAATSPEAYSTDAYSTNTPSPSGSSGWQYEAPASNDGVNDTTPQNGSTSPQRWGSGDTNGQSSSSSTGSSMSWFGRASRSSSQAKVATVASGSPLSQLSALQKSLMAVAVAAVFGGVGWVLYTRTQQPSVPPSEIATNDSNDSSASSDGELLPDETTAEETDRDSQAEVTETPEPDEAPRPDAESSPIIDSTEATTDELTEDADPESSARLDSRFNRNDSSTSAPELSPEIQDPFTEAVRLAEEAVVSGESANTPEEWSQIAEQWQRASALMAIVPQSDERFSVARDRTVLYRTNGEFARQKVLELISVKDFSDEN